MALQNSDFLRFSAYSFKDMITKKMSENTKFTDQIYEDSNLAILIDLCAYLFQGLVYSLNNAAAESMFSDTQIYENISRLVKLIGYNPKGFIPAQATFQFYCETDDDDELHIPPYAAVKTDLTDSNGNTVYYSFSNITDVSNGKNEIILKNGIWKLYSTIFTANGSNYETFVLDGLKSDSSTDDPIIAHGGIDVYIKRNGKFIKFKGLTDEIFISTTSKITIDPSPKQIYKNTDDDRYFVIRLNEDKVYEIKFGNDINGQRLQANDQVYIFYLQTNGFDGKLSIVGEVTDKNVLEPASMLGLTDDIFYKGIVACVNTFENGDFDTTDTAIANVKELLSNLRITNTTISTVPTAEESVEDIRTNAPNYYKLGNRLITKDDFEYYIINRFEGEVIDVKCFNNWDYLSKFFGWLYKLGLHGNLVDRDYNGHKSDGQYYISNTKLTKYGYIYSDAADCNDIYLWIKYKEEGYYTARTEELKADIQNIKTLTAELRILVPITVKFAICAAPQKQTIAYLQNEIGVFDSNNENYIEITISDNSLYSSTAVKVQINQIFLNFFNITKQTIGKIIDFNKLTQEIYEIAGVQKVRTVYSSPDGMEYDRYIDGISMASWSSSLIDIGDDVVIGANNRTLEDFQFPELYHSSITNKIKVIKKSFNNSSSIQY